MTDVFGGGKNRNTAFSPYLASEHERDGAVGACYLAVTQHWRNAIQVLDAGRHARRTRAGYIDRSAIEQVPGVCFLTRCPLTDPGTHPHLSAQCAPASVRSVDSRREWLSGELRSSHAACGEEPCTGRADDGKRRGGEKRIRGKARQSGTIRFSAECEDQPLPCFTLSWEMDEGGLPLSCHWVSEIQRQRKREREERGGASWCMVRLKRENSNTFGSQESLIGQPERKSGVFLVEPSGMTVSPL